MAKLTKKLQLRIFHIFVYVLLAVLVYLEMDSIVDFARDYEVLAAILSVVIIAMPAFLHVFVFLKKRK
ncbi:MAG: hypothetical protein ACPKM0_01765 [Pleomorphochaeta sp.]